MALTRASQFPLVPMEKVKGLYSHAAVHSRPVLSDAPWSRRMEYVSLEEGAGWLRTAYEYHWFNERFRHSNDCISFWKNRKQYEFSLLPNGLDIRFRPDWLRRGLFYLQDACLEFDHLRRCLQNQ